MHSLPLRIREKEAGVEIPLHVQPRARCSGIAGLHAGALKLKVTAPPAGGAANRAVIDHLAAVLGLPRSRFRFLAGEASRAKVLRIEGITIAAFLEGISGELPLGG